MFLKLANIALRAASLGGKMILTLYMGRFLTLADLGIYGIVWASVAVLCLALGWRTDYVVGREIVGADPVTVLRKMRDQALFYAVNFLLFAVVLSGVGATGAAAPSVLLAIFVLSVLESLADMTYVNMVSLGRPLAATFLFFLRAGLWSLVVVAVGLMFPELRDVKTVLFAWCCGTGLSLVLTLWLWRAMPWRRVLCLPVDWIWMKGALWKSFPIWLGTIGGEAAVRVDRFVVSHYLGIEEVGILTFYASFATALLPMVFSGVFAFATPRLIKFHRSGDKTGFWRETGQTAIQAFIIGSVLGIAIGVLLPFAAPYFNKPELVMHVQILWFLLVAVWLSINSSTLHLVLYARGQDRAIWLGSLLYLVPSLVGNLVLVPKIGLLGIGYSAIFAAIFLFLWRVGHVWGYKEKKNSAKVIKDESISPTMAEFLDP